MKNIKYLLLIVIGVLLIFVDKPFNHDPLLFKDLFLIDHIVYSTGYEWRGSGHENELLALLATVKKVEIANKENLASWTQENPVEISLFRQGEQIFHISVYQPLANSTGRSEGLILESNGKIYLLPAIGWAEFLTLCEENKDAKDIIFPLLKPQDIVFYHIYSSREGVGSSEYRYSLEKDIEGDWQLILSDIYTPEDKVLNQSEVTLLLRELTLWQGERTPYREGLPETVNYTLEIRDSLGRRYLWQVGPHNEEGIYLVSSPSDQISFLTTQNELKKVSPPVSRLWN